MKVTMSDWKGAKIETHRRVGISVGTMLIILAFCYFAPPEAEFFDKIGMLLAVVTLSVFLWKFPIGAYAMPQIFTLTAAAGSILKLYDLFPGYDRVVHFISGIILGYLGYYIIDYLFKRLELPHETFIMILFSGLFSAFCAGGWEIIEFTTDTVFHAIGSDHLDVQHGNSDTMGDIVSGYLGAALYQLIKMIEHHSEFSKAKIRNFFKHDEFRLKHKK